MCGIAGFWGPRDRALLWRMTRIQEHRGPDDEGLYESDFGSLGSRRLSIIDLAHGHQPMAIAGGRLQIAYNGEVYNYRELRGELMELGERFFTDSDTEVVLRAYQVWGPQSFARLNGMWGLAILDLRDEPKMVISRDHFGIKPVYWAASADRILFASEIKALLQDPALRPEPNEQRIYEYLGWGLHDHDEQTFFEGIRALAPASYAVLDADGFAQHTYWEPRLSTDGDPDPATFRALLDKSVERRLVADVPVGTCLSGGLDSSSIVCLMNRQLEAHVPDATSMGDRLKTFSAIFDNDPIDERRYMQLVLDATGAEGNFVKPTSERFIEELPELVWHLDEPMVSTGP
ncbi:MAG: asparagine synthase (glutamine-hydrolyzing), partial [Chloroflexota bacterium]|nr:asparagine synthase (glutamine-hydrolyzing) [Chloroflexota bacterium]